MGIVNKSEQAMRMMDPDEDGVIPWRWRNLLHQQTIQVENQNELQWSLELALRWLRFITFLLLVLIVAVVVAGAFAQIVVDVINRGRS